jgi:eukaryotic-like serine/threonine-protein kinase
VADVSDAHPSWELVTGDLVVPHCTVRRLMGGGQSYETYEAVDDRLLVPVVVKVVRPHLTRHDGVLRDLRREIALTERLKHPLIGRNLHHDADGTRPYVALERLPGRPLDQILTDQGRLPLERAASVGLGIATVLHYLRYEDVVHLDVNTNNIILDDRVPRLIDFDIARSADEAAEITFSTGSPRCAAPEQFMPPAHGRPTPASDVWGLGATLFRCVTGRFPYPLPSQDPSASAADKDPQSNLPPREIPDTVPPAFAAVITACLQRDPGQRPTPLVLVEALQALAPHLAPTIQRNTPS